MNIPNALHGVNRYIKTNGPELCVGLSLSGLLSTSVLTARATVSAQKTLDGNTYSRKETAKRVWKHFIPPALSILATGGLIVYGNRMSAKRLATSAGLLSVTQQAFDVYRKEVTEAIGSKKEELIAAKIAERQTSDAPTIVVGEGAVMCHEAFTGRYFMSDMETLRKVTNDINAKLNTRDVATLSDFYHLLNLSPTAQSDHTGWTIDRLLELRYTSVLASGGRPCLSFEYNYVKQV